MRIQRAAIDHAFWAWVNEAAGDRARRAWAAAALAVLSAAALGLASAQGHASHAPVPAVSIAFDAVHLGAAAVWVGGLVSLGAVLRVAPRAWRCGRRPDAFSSVHYVCERIT